MARVEEPLALPARPVDWTHSDHFNTKAVAMTLDTDTPTDITALMGGGFEGRGGIAVRRQW